MNRFLVATVFTLATSSLALVGCNKPADGESSEEGGAEGDETQTLVGTWEADMSTFEMAALDAMPEADRTQVMAMLATGVMRLTNNDDGSYSSFNRNPMNGEEYTETGTWEVLSTEGDLVTVRTTEENDTRGPEEVDEEPEEVQLRIVDEDTLMMIDEDDDGGSITVQMNRL